MTSELLGTPPAPTTQISTTPRDVPAAAAGPGAADHAVADHRGDGRTERDAWAREVGAALEQLPAVQRVVLKLAYLDRLTYRQVAARLRRPEPDVCACAVAALRRMDQLLEQP